MSKIKDWLFEEENDVEVKSDMIIKDYTINDFNRIEEIGTNMKNNEILLCRISNDIFTRTMDYLSGIAFILEYKAIPVDKHIYLFVPHTVQYLSNS